MATTTGQEAYEARGRLQGQTTKTPTQIQAQLYKLQCLTVEQQPCETRIV